MLGNLTVGSTFQSRVQSKSKGIEMGQKTVARRGIASGPVSPETVEMVQPVELCGPCAVRDARVQVVAAAPVVALRRRTCLIITTTPLPSK